MHEITKADWKLFCERIPMWQERCMEKLLKEYVQIINSDESAASRFWELEKRIKNNKKYPGVQMELRKSTAVFDIALFERDGIITLDDLDGFSIELIETVKNIVKN